MRRIGVVGANGYLGSALYAALSLSAQNITLPVTRENYSEMRKENFDILINCAMPAARFWAKQNPAADFKETVERTADLLYGWQYRKLVQVSTVSARCQLDTIYGRHKAAAESLCDAGVNLIIRLGAIYSDTLTKGVLMDMVQNRTVFVAADSRYCFTPLGFLANWIASNLDRSGLVEVGSHNAISLREVAQFLGSTSAFEGAVDHQEIEHPEPDFPSAREVLDFLDRWKRLPQIPNI